ncbi:kelch-like protein 10 [Zootermopsis nevadensis]|uniref:Kelch-like protein diablo n=1 Tax=Zootermopsis nevadensis TaxID=136037 RepID=A0A067R1Z0_ZOONE|nr:kelch-like protein 10 [Zootermopsis nevadensis]KDR11663.1 Kelch-like protein 10 [Zootermopsis nevadensis]
METNKHRSCFHDGGRCTCSKALVPLNELRDNNLLSDAVFRLEDGGVFRVHRAILSMRSTYFRQLFTTTLHKSEETDILLHGISSDLMTPILDCVYYREFDIRSDNACRLLVAADHLCIPDVTEPCCDFLKDTMDADNCIGIMQLARFHFFADLETHARRFVLRHFVQLSQQKEEMLELSAEELQAIIESEELNVKDEKVVWEFILRWINHDPGNRKGHIVDLLKGVRLGLLDAKFFTEMVSSHPYVTQNEDCSPVISETLTFFRDVEMMKKEDKEFVTPRIAYPRIPQDFLLAVCGRRDESPTDVIEAYDARADRWSVVADVEPIGPRVNHGTAVVGFDIYIIGGFDGVEVLRSCRCFNAVTKTRREVAPMKARRRRLSVAVLRNAVYAVGGYGRSEVTSTAESYDPKTNQWSLINPMNTQRCDAAAAVLNDKIYVAAGYDDRIFLNSVEVYDPDTNQWTFVAPMRIVRNDGCCIAFHGCLYALGGYRGISHERIAEKYNPEEDTWTDISDIDFEGRIYNAEVIDDTIFVIGEYERSVTTLHVKCFNDKENRWFVSLFV